MPLQAVGTSWHTGKGLDLAEAKALIECCTALDYGPDKPPDYANVTKPGNAVGWEAIYSTHEILPANAIPTAIGPYSDAWKP